MNNLNILKRNIDSVPKHKAKRMIKFHKLKFKRKKKHMKKV